MSDRIQTVIKNVLLAFVLVTIGFAMGKRSATRTREASQRETPAPAAATESAEEGIKVIVTYLHATFRCVTCNTIEAMAKETVETRFSKALSSGTIEWRTANYQEREDLAERYEVVAACVVVSKMVNGEETDYQRLDDVWILMKDPSAFEKYVSDAILGSGTALPVIGFAFLIAFATERVGKAFNRLTQIENWVRRIAGILFILAGIYYCMTHIYGVHIP